MGGSCRVRQSERCLSQRTQAERAGASWNCDLESGAQEAAEIGNMRGDPGRAAGSFAARPAAGAAGIDGDACGRAACRLASGRRRICDRLRVARAARWAPRKTVAHDDERQGGQAELFPVSQKNSPKSAPVEKRRFHSLRRRLE